MCRQAAPALEQRSPPKRRRIVFDGPGPAACEAGLPPARQGVTRARQAAAQPLVSINGVEIGPVGSVVIAVGEGGLGAHVAGPLERWESAQRAPVAVRLRGIVDALEPLVNP